MTMDKYISSQAWYRIAAVGLCAIGVLGFYRAVQKSQERIFSSVIDVNETEVAGWLDDLRHNPYVNFVEAGKAARAGQEWVPVSKQDIDKYMAGRTTFTIKCDFTGSEYLPIAKSLQLTGTLGQQVSLYDEALQRIAGRQRDVVTTSIVAAVLVIAGLAFGAKSFRLRPGNLLRR
jgi:hypothetical protein